MTAYDIDARLADGARLMWVCAHPDDEFLTGALLARAALHHGCPVHIVILTDGAGGSNAIDADDLGATRKQEMARVAERLGATCEVHDFWNARLPASSFPTREKLYHLWQQDGDPAAVIRDAITAFAPDIVVTFEPTHGATGHPEHQLVSRLTTQVVAEMDFDGNPPEVLYALRRHLIWRLMKQADPGPVDGWFDGAMPCGDDGTTCQDVLIELTLLHKTQEKDMGMFRKAAPLFRKLGLRVVDPATAPAPDAPA